MIDLQHAQDFLDKLVAHTATFQTFDDSLAKHHHLARTLHGTLEQHGEVLQALNQQGAGVFVTINATDGQGRKKESVTAVRGVFADFDKADSERVKTLALQLAGAGLEPTIIVESSPGKHHYYWLAHQPGELALDEFKPLQKALAGWLGSDSKVSDLPRVMRLPGFIHHKGEPFQSRIVHTGEYLAADAIRAAIPTPPAPAPAPPQVVPMPASGNAYTQTALTGAYADIAAAPEGDRNQVLYQKARRAFSVVHASQAEADEVRTELEVAAGQCGLEAGEIEATLASAWNASKKEPDDVSPASERFGAERPPEDALERVTEALNRTKDDPGAIFEPGILRLITSIRQDSPADWQRIRASAKKAKVPVVELDKLTQPETGQGQCGNVLFPTVEPWPDPVDGAALVRELSDTLRQYVVCEPEVADAAALWIAFTWFIDEVHIAPIANITAPLPNCGKSTLLDFMERFAFQPLKCDGISPAALFRSMDRWRPTLLIDEVDSFLHDNEDARGVLNSGHKRNGFIIRVVGEDHDPTRFSTWGAKALCGIGSIADTLASRSIPLELRRKLPHEEVSNIRFMDGETVPRITGQLCRLHDDIAGQVRNARPQPVVGLSNRAQDNWEPLLQIADTIGGEWPERARSIAITITHMDGGDQVADVGTDLLRDIKAIFEARGADRIFSTDLLAALEADSEAPWITWNRGKPITARQVASRLAGFNIRSKQMRIGETTKKGYLLKDLQDAFKRYLPAGPQVSSETTKQSHNHAGYSGFPSETLPSPVSDRNRNDAHNHAVCFGVSDRNPSHGEYIAPWLENHPLL